jgi:broad specificity phosphatase PhoE
LPRAPAAVPELARGPAPAPGAGVPGPTITVVRHGETEWSENGRHTSRTELALIDLGRRRAAALAAGLAVAPYGLVLISPRRRAAETAALAGFGAVAEVCPDLSEWDYGDYEGLTTAEIWALDPAWDLWRDGCPGGESPAAVGARADAIIARALAAPGDVLCFAHGHLLRVLAARWLEAPVAFGRHLALSPARPGVLGYERATRVLASWNCPLPGAEAGAGAGDGAC